VGLVEGLGVGEDTGLDVDGSLVGWFDGLRVGFMSFDRLDVDSF
jgi:hypothetical protein